MCSCAGSMIIVRCENLMWKGEAGLPSLTRLNREDRFKVELGDHFRFWRGIKNRASFVSMISEDVIEKFPSTSFIIYSSHPAGLSG